MHRGRKIFLKWPRSITFKGVCTSFKANRLAFFFTSSVYLFCDLSLGMYMYAITLVTTFFTSALRKNIILPAKISSITVRVWSAW